MLLKEVIEQFEKHLIVTDKSEETVRGYRRDLNSFLCFLEEGFNGPVYVDEIKTKDIESYLFHLKEKKLKSSSRSRQLYTLRSFFSYVYKNKLCKWNIAMEIEPIKIQKKERTYLSIEEFKELVNEIDNNIIKTVIVTLFYTGMRISECLNLKLDDVDIEEEIIHVIEGKGKKDRDIPINATLKKELIKYIESVRPDVHTNNFFATKKTGGVSSVYVNRVINDTVKRLGWKKHVTAHILRHSFASNLIKNGVSLVHVQKLLGHSNLKVTSIYTHANMEELAESVDTL